MTKRGLDLFRTLCAGLAAMVVLVSMPATAAFSACDDRGGACVVSCEKAACDIDPGEGSDSTQGCAHCAFSHVGHSIAAPASASEVAAFDPSRDAFARRDDVRGPAAALDRPEHPPKA